MVTIYTRNPVISGKAPIERKKEIVIQGSLAIPLRKLIG
jgi:hypothetical protein